MFWSLNSGVGLHTVAKWKYEVVENTQGTVLKKVQLSKIIYGKT